MRHALGCTTSVAAAAVMLLAACGSDDDTSSASTPAVPTAAAGTSTRDTKLIVHDFAFGTVSGAKAGEAIEVENQDAAAHTATADDGAFDVELDPKSTAEITVEKAGTYTFHCEIHPQMTGTLTVG